VAGTVQNAVVWNGFQNGGAGGFVALQELPVTLGKGAECGFDFLAGKLKIPAGVTDGEEGGGCGEGLLRLRSVSALGR